MSKFEIGEVVRVAEGDELTIEWVGDESVAGVLAGRRVSVPMVRVRKISPEFIVTTENRLPKAGESYVFFDKICHALLDYDVADERLPVITGVRPHVA